MNRTARKIAASAAASTVALALTAPAAVADEDSHLDGERSYSTSQHDDGEWAADGGSTGHGDGDERHDARHEKWGGQGTEDDDESTDDDGENAGASGATTMSVEGGETWSRGYRGHGEGDERHDGRHEKWGGQGTEEGEESTEDTTGETTGETTEDTTEDTTGDGATDGFDEDRARILDRLGEAQAFLTDLRQRIEQADMDPTLQQTLLDLVDARLATVTDLITQVEAATSYDDLRLTEGATDGTGALTTDTPLVS